MRLPLRIVIVFVLGALAPGLVACEQATWKMSEQSLAALARHVDARARQGDTQYFGALTPDRQAVPAILQQITRSGLATNYAEHLIIESPDSGVLAYGLMGDRTEGVSFAIRVSLVGGEARVDQIVTHPGESTGGSLPSTVASLSAEGTPSVVGSLSVSVSTSTRPLRGYGWQSALIGLTNTSIEGTSVTVPLDLLVRITDSQDRLVAEGFEPSDSLQPIRSEFLAPGGTVYGTVRFVAPEPGIYKLNGRANGVWSGAVELETVY